MVWKKISHLPIEFNDQLFWVTLEYSYQGEVNRYTDLARFSSAWEEIYQGRLLENEHTRVVAWQPLLEKPPKFYKGKV